MSATSNTPASGSGKRRRPIPIEGTEFVIDTVVIAAGNEAHPLIPQTTRDIAVDRWGHILTDEVGRTSKKAVFGGELVTRAATVIEAMGAGKRAARAMYAYLAEK